MKNLLFKHFDHKIARKNWAKSPFLKTKFNSLERAVDAYRSDLPVTMVCLPSLTFDRKHLSTIRGVSHYESRSLWEILNLKNKKNLKIIFVSTRRIDREIIAYYCGLAGITEDQLRDRLEIIALEDFDIELGDISLVDALLTSKEAMNYIRKQVQGKRAFLRPFMSTESESRLSRYLKLPIWAIDEELKYYLTKSGNHAIFRQAGVAHAKHIADIKTIDDLKLAILRLWEKLPSQRRFMFKFDNGVSGKGLGLMSVPMEWNEFKQKNNEDQNEVLDHMIKTIDFRSGEFSQKEFLSYLAKGSVLEEFFEGDLKFSPSGQALIFPNGDVQLISSHEQILDENGVTYLGSYFPANNAYRETVDSFTKKVAETLSLNGVVGPLSVDFLVVESNGDYQVYAIEINIRQGGTTHPYQMASFLVNGHYCSKSGALVNEQGEKRVFRSHDNLLSTSKGKLAYLDFIDLIKNEGIHYCPRKKSGFVFHMLGCLTEYGKVGYTLLANDFKDFEQYEQKLDQILKSL